MGLRYLFVDNPAVIGEEWQGIEHKGQYVQSKIRFQFRVETNRMQACVQKPTTRRSEGSDSLWYSVTNLLRF